MSSLDDWVRSKRLFVQGQVPVNIEKTLQKYVIGKPTVSVVSKAIRRNRSGVQARDAALAPCISLADRCRKTELAKVLAREFLAAESALVKMI